jgi:hypothetical protein
MLNRSALCCRADPGAVHFYNRFGRHHAWHNTITCTFIGTKTPIRVIPSLQFGKSHGIYAVVKRRSCSLPPKERS